MEKCKKPLRCKGLCFTGEQSCTLVDSLVARSERFELPTLGIEILSESLHCIARHCMKMQ